MNANELADALTNTHYTPLKAKCVVMLRQLQVENEALKADNKRLKGFCWETDEAKEFLESIRKAQET
jgi:hypothetical protein